MMAENGDGCILVQFGEGAAGNLVHRDDFGIWQESDGHFPRLTDVQKKRRVGSGEFLSELVDRDLKIHGFSLARTQDFPKRVQTPEKSCNFFARVLKSLRCRPKYKMRYFAVVRNVLFVCCIFLWFLTGTAGSASVLSFFNTGVNQSGGLLAAGSADSHYSLIYNPDGVLETAQATTPNSVWVQNTRTAGWISPGASGTTSWTAGYYIYEATLDLTGYDPMTAVLSGLLAADNGVSIYLNRGSAALFSGEGFSSLTGFTITSGFVSGVNLVDFVVRNDGGPTGLLVDSTRATASVVPEPAALLLVATGAAMIYAVARLLRQESRRASHW